MPDRHTIPLGRPAAQLVRGAQPRDRIIDAFDRIPIPFMYADEDVCERTDVIVPAGTNDDCWRRAKPGKPNAGPPASGLSGVRAGHWRRIRDSNP